MLEIDLRDITPRELIAQLSPGVAQQVLIDIAGAARAKWIMLANEKLRSSQQTYVNGISPVRTALNLAWIELLGAFPNMVENGFGPFDMRETLLGANTDYKVSEDGHRYRSIFFRRGGETSTSRNFPRITDLYAEQLGKQRAKQLGRAAAAEAKKLSPSRSKRGGGTDWGERLPEGMAPKQKPHHVTDLFAGTYRIEQTYERATQSYLGAFRTISTGSGHPDSWIHPGYQPGAHLVEEVGRYMDRVAPAMFAAAAGEKKDP